MENQVTQQPVRRRRRRRRPKWQRILHKYWPTIRFCLVVLLLFVLIFLGIRAIVRAIRSTPNQDGPIEASSEATTEPTLSPDEILKSADALVIQADSMAAGYDYLGAARLLEDFPYFADVPSLAAKVSEYQQADTQLVTYEEIDNITHVFFHSLIVDNSRAFDGESTQTGYNQFMTTIPEFMAILQSMYDRGYVLVSPYDVAAPVTDSTGTHFTFGTIRLPAGKTPFIMSQDDVNYYGYMIGGKSGATGAPVFANTKGDGFASRIVIDENGYPTCEYMDAQGNVTTGDYDLVPLLEKFIQAHPDFSYHGARAILGVTGYEGVFGYRTKPAYKEYLGEDAYNREIEAAKEVAKCLKDHGWLLASHSYGHPAYGELTSLEVEEDSDKWENTVQPIIGNTDILLYPYGSDIAGTEHYDQDNAKFNALYADGYRYFFNVDGHTAWIQLGDNYFRGGRRNLDGYRMYYNPGMLDDLFDAEEVFDPDRPTPVPPI